MVGTVSADTEISALGRLVLLCQRGSIGEVLPRRVLEALGGLLDADVVEIVGLNPPVQVAYLCGPGDGDCHRSVAPGGDEVERPFWRHYWFTERNAFTGMQHEISLELADFAGRTVKLTCWRAQGPEFDERCRTYLQLVKPHLEQAYRAVSDVA
jgi:hypothetical protein